MRKPAQASSCSTLLRAAAVLALAGTLGLASHVAHAACPGDCSGDRTVTVNELITMVNIALGTAAVSTCTAGDVDRSGEITINEVIAGVNAALDGCPPPSGNGVCGDNQVDADLDEECDDGGICIGGTNAGTPCAGEVDCQGEGVCDAFGFPGGGERKVCSSDADCAGAKCVRCKPFGGDRCAANCTVESPILFILKPGEVDGTDIKIATSGAVVHGDILTILSPLSGTQTLLIGKPRRGRMPLAQRPEGTQFPRIPFSTLACECVRGAVFKTCGGTTKEADGVADSTDCTEDASVCAGKKPCTAVAGPGNSGEGTIACDSLRGVNFTVTQDAGGESAPAGPPRYSTEPDSGGPGSALLASSSAIGAVAGLCTGATPAYGTDGEFCTDDDPPASRGTVGVQVLTTGTACAAMLNANDIDGNNIGPYCRTGVPLSCGELASGITSGAALAGAFTTIDQLTVGDIAVTNILVAQ